MTKVSEKQDLYQQVTDRIIEHLEKGEIPWRKTWSGYGLARNLANNHIYTGINMILMNCLPFSIPYYLTFKQVQEKGGKIKQGAKSVKVFYFNILFKDGADNSLSKEEATALEKRGGEVKIFKYLKYYNVFNVKDIEGIEYQAPEVKLLPHEKLERCEQIILNMPNTPEIIHEDLGSAYYNKVHDFVNMPQLGQFDTPEAYYTTFFHELAHATGHEKRLNRIGITDSTKFGDKKYSEEELIAEMAASFISAHQSIDYDPIIENTAAYLQGWLKVLKEDKLFIFKVAAEAQKAADYILGVVRN
jgi:antirestriction protein ArdC